jgi:hypothetical protein
MGGVLVRGVCRGEYFIPTEIGHEVGENCIRRTFIICTLNQILLR